MGHREPEWKPPFAMPGSTEDGAISVRTRGDLGGLALWSHPAVLSSGPEPRAQSGRCGKEDAVLHTSAHDSATASSPWVPKQQDFLVKNDDDIAASRSSVFENNLVSHLLEKVIQYVFFLLKRKKRWTQTIPESTAGVCVVLPWKLTCDLDIISPLF